MSKPNSTNYRHYVLGIAILVLYRFALLYFFGFEYTDSDQTVQWVAARDMAQGDFYEPRFYGQAYGSSIEALMAAPLVLLGVSVSKALPISTLVLYLIIVLNIGALFIRRGTINAALFTVVFLLAAPRFNDLVVSLPRSFLPGLSLASFLLYFDKKWFHLRGGIMSGLIIGLGFTLNANSLLFSLPLLGLFAFERSFTIKDLKGLSIGILIAALIHFSINLFYLFHSEVVVHSYDSSASLSSFPANFSKIGFMLWGTLPLPLGLTGWLVWIVLMALSLVALKNWRTPEAVSLLIFVSGFTLSLFFSKSGDGTHSIFFSSSRMYLALVFLAPILIGRTLHQWLTRVPTKLWVLLAILLASVKLSFGFRSYLETPQLVQVTTVAELEGKCNQLDSLYHFYQVDFVVVDQTLHRDLINYGCAALESDLNIVRPRYERRSWVLKRYENESHSRILFLSDHALPENTDLSSFNVVMILPDMYLFEGNPQEGKQWNCTLQINCK